jgi:phosphatidylglycerol lysyltransferase
VLAPEALPLLLPRLREISAEWLMSKAGKEKGFSVGQFDESYLSNFSIAVLRDSNGEIFAFANVLRGNGRKEISIDLMRYIPESPNGMMDYLFICLFQWGRDQGYEEFNLGVAPLAGLERHPLHSVWTRLGVWIFRHGEHFYNFQGLRDYKNKFNPQWRPRYLASVSNRQIPQELLSITRLISGGLRPKSHVNPQGDASVKGGKPS